MTAPEDRPSARELEPEDPPRHDENETSEWGLEWGDISQIRERLKLTPAERLQVAQELINAALRIRARNAG